jgi:glycopeptide antibiotics resistance protein
VPRQVFDAALHIALIVVPAWIALRVTLRARRTRSVPSFAREGFWALAVLYAIVLAAVTVYPLPSSRRTAANVPTINLVPLVAPLRCIEPTRLGWRSMRSFCQSNIAGNVALFVPFGFLLPICWRTRTTVVAVAVCALGLSVAIEATQFAERAIGVARTVDIDDVILNVAGACVGFRSWWVWVRREPPREW